MLLLLMLLMLVCTQAVVGVAGGATRAALTQHQARRNNMADVSAKDGSQVLETASFSSLYLLLSLGSDDILLNQTDKQAC